MARILSLDDEFVLLTFVQIVLERAGHESLVTTRDEEALSILRTQSIDLVTQDWCRPGMGAVGFLRAIKSDKALRSIPVLIITAGVMRDDRAEQLKRVGLDFDRDLAGYINKPFSPEKLLNTIEAILEEGSKPPLAE